MGECLIQRISIAKYDILPPALLDRLFPIDGPPYITTDNKRTPSDLFGGTWEQVNGFYLRSSDTNIYDKGGSMMLDQAVGNTSAVTLNSNTMPYHNHYIKRDYNSKSGSGTTAGAAINPGGKNNMNSYTQTPSGGSGSHLHTLGNHTHDFTLKDVSFFVWRRVS